MKLLLASTSAGPSNEPILLAQGGIHAMSPCQVRAELGVQQGRKTNLTRENSSLDACPPEAGAQGKSCRGAEG